MTDQNRPFVVTEADLPGGKRPGEWTYDDYAALPDDGQRYEIIDGVLYMTPAPGMAHQVTVAVVTAELTNRVMRTGRGMVIPSPVDLELAPKVVVQPDVVVVLMEHAHILRADRIVGAPDLVIEVQSPSIATYDRVEKQRAYARAGIPEYWLADPVEETIEPLYLENGRHRSSGIYRDNTLIPSRVLPDLDLRVSDLFVRLPVVPNGG